MKTKYFKLKIDNQTKNDDNKEVNYNHFIEISGNKQLRVVFNILKDFDNSISYADIKIYGLRKDTINKYLHRNSSIEVVAGYQIFSLSNVDNKYSSIFKGKITNAFVTGLIPNTYLQLYAITGSQNKKIINKSLAANSTVLDIIKNCTSAMGYPYHVESNKILDWKTLPRGYKLSGDPEKILNKTSKAYNFNWLNDGDKIIITANDSYRELKSNPITWENGLVSIPQANEVGINLILNLINFVRIGDKITVKSEFQNYNYSSLYFEKITKQSEIIVKKIRYIGDNYSEITMWHQEILGYYE